jgi:alpha-methylacyl-CoA racemase
LATAPLEGLRVVDLTRLLPGGLCTLLLADLGAEVVKVEQPGIGDYARAREPFYADAEPSTASTGFVGLNRGKRSVVVDLKSDEGRQGFLQLVETSDVVVESFRPGVMRRLGLGFDQLREAQPRIVYCAITGWGQHGSHSQLAGHDINYLASTGLLSSTGGPNEAPTLASVQVADGGGALVAALAVLAALRQRDATGEPQEVDVSLAHSALALAGMSAAAALAGADVPPREGAIFSGGVVCYQAYRCADGWVALGALEEQFWLRWCGGVGRDDLAGERYAPTGSAVHAQVRDIFLERTRAEWQRFGEEHDCCLNAVLGLDEALASDHVRDRGMVVAIPQTGTTNDVEVLGSPIRASWTKPPPARPAPALGEHTELYLAREGA